MHSLMIASKDALEDRKFQEQSSPIRVICTMMDPLLEVFTKWAVIPFKSAKMHFQNSVVLKKYKTFSIRKDHFPWLRMRESSEPK